MAFLLVYIREAHPEDGRQVSANLQDDIIIRTPVNAGERTHIAESCRAGLHLSIPMLIDGMDNAIEAAYASWPDRLYVVGADGKLAYAGAPGPAGFHPEEMQATLDRLLAGGVQPPKLRLAPGADAPSLRALHPSRPAEPYTLILPATLGSGSRSLLPAESPPWSEIIPGRLLRYEQKLGDEFVLRGEARADEGSVHLALSLKNLTDQPLRELRAGLRLVSQNGADGKRLVLRFPDCAPKQTVSAAAALTFPGDGTEAAIDQLARE